MEINIFKVGVEVCFINIILTIIGTIITSVTPLLILTTYFSFCLLENYFKLEQVVEECVV